MRLEGRGEHGGPPAAAIGIEADIKPIGGGCQANGRGQAQYPAPNRQKNAMGFGRKRKKRGKKRLFFFFSKSNKTSLCVGDGKEKETAARQRAFGTIGS